MNSIFDTVLAYFQDKAWTFTQLEGKTVLQMSVSTEGTRWDCFADSREEGRQLIFYSVAPFFAYDERRVEVAEFITRANYGLILGNFEMDFDDGEVRFKTSINVGDDDLTTVLVDRLFDANVRAMTSYLQGIKAVNDGASPSDEISGIETREYVKE